MQYTKFDKDGLQYRFYLVPDFSETQSVWMFNVQHCFADGVGLVSTLCALRDNYNKANLID